MKYNIHMPEAVCTILHILHDHGQDAYIVGGCVRDSLLGKTPHDYDICTSAMPETVMGIFDDKFTIPTGLKHGTVTVMFGKTGYEVTTFRVDGDYSDNRHPDSVSFTRSLTEDLKRRDFTINAIAYNEEEGIIDPFNGIEDLKNGIIRCVGNPEERFTEDALRIIRAIRFACQLGFTIDTDTDEKVIELASLLDNIAIERINSEFCKIITSETRLEPIFRQYLSVFERFIPELRTLYGFDQNNPHHDFDVFTHTMRALDNCPSSELITRLAVFFHDFGKPICYQDDAPAGIRHFRGHGAVSASITDTVMERMRFDNRTRGDVVELVKYHDVQLTGFTKRSIRRLLNKLGEQQLRRLLDVRTSDVLGQKENNTQETRIGVTEEVKKVLDEIIAERDCFQIKDLAVNGRDLIEIGFTPGKELGLMLRELLDMVMADELHNTKEELLQYAKDILYDLDD